LKGIYKLLFLHHVVKVYSSHKTYFFVHYLSLLSNGYQGGALSLGVKHAGREADHSPPSSAVVKECVEPYLHYPNTPSWRGAQLKKQSDFTFTFTFSVVTRLRAGRRGFDSRQGQRIFLVTAFWNPPSFLSNEYSEALSLGINRSVREVDQSLQCTAEVKNAWSCTSTPQVRLHGVVLKLNTEYVFKLRDCDLCLLTNFMGLVHAHI